jgi:4-hydroxy-4-methyl-2-oxoglutarate aldolase
MRNALPENHTPAEITDFVARLRRLDACAVSDAFDRLGLTGVVTGVPQQAGSGRIAGRAVTFKVGLGEPQAGPVRHLGTMAVEAAGPDDVIVVEQRSGLDAGCWGGLLTLGAKMRGVAGVVADGPVRDIDEARAYGFPIFARVLTARTARGRVVELSVGAPVAFHGVRVDPGDYLIADASAIVVIAAAHISKVLEVAEDIVVKEAAMAKALMTGASIAAVMGGAYEHMLKS